MAAAATTTLVALMAAAAMAGALAAVIILEGEEGPPSAGPAGGGGDAAPPGGGGQGAGTTGTVDFAQRPQAASPSRAAAIASATGTVDFAQRPREPPQDPTQREEPPQDPPPKPPVRAGDVRAPPLPGAAAPPPPGARAFYTMADLVEFVDSGAAHSSVAVLAARFPVGGNAVNIMTGGLAELDGASPGMRPEDGGRMPAAMPDEDIAEWAAEAGPQMDAAMAADDAGEPAAAPEAAAPSSAPAMAPPPPAHSTTNVQVEGVDEPDFVKNDARHIYILDGGELTIVDALPADTVRVLSGGSAGEVRDSYRPEDASIVFRGPVGPPPGEHRYDSMFLDGDSLVVVYGARQWASVPLDPADPSRTIAVRLPSTHVMWVDIADRAAPEPAGEYSVDGEYLAARMIDGTVYLATRTALEAGGHGPPGLPSLRHTALEDGRPGVPCRAPSDGPSPQAPACSTAPLVPPALYLAPVEEEPALVTVSALPPAGGGPEKPAAQTYLLGGAGIAYVSHNAAYLALPRMAPGAADVLEGLRDTGLLRAMAEPIGERWRQEVLAAAADMAAPPEARLEAALSAVQSGYDGMEPEKRAAALQALDEEAWSWHYAAVPADPRTDVHRIEIGAAPGGGGPAISYAGAGTVRGEPLDQFSIDEHGGRLRIATEVRDGIGPSHTAVHILDAKTMAVESSLEGIAPGEAMESARFAGDTLFLVTFLQVDPFFVVDVSGAVPAILGELKVPGFSTYLQPYGPGMVLGVGTYVSEGVGEPGRDWAVKVSLYDVSDYARPLLADEAVIEGSAWSPAQSNHRALLADAGRGIVALPVVFDWGGPDPSGAPAFGMQGDADGSGSGWTGFYAFRTDAEAQSLGVAHAIRHGAAADGAPPEGRSLYIADWLYTIYDGVLAISYLDDPGRLVKAIDLAGR